MVHNGKIYYIIPPSQGDREMSISSSYLKPYIYTSRTKHFIYSLFRINAVQKKIKGDISHGLRQMKESEVL